ncbi:MAG TPA: hypothetical protein DCR74_03135 [Achromobacter sp.]|nr:hypothetical protein [Achromobacter sp.]
MRVAVFTMEGPEIVLVMTVYQAEGGGFRFELEQRPVNDSERQAAQFHSILRYSTAEDAEAEGKRVTALLARGKVDPDVLGTA